MNRRRADDEITSLRQQLRKVKERNTLQFELGFAAAVKMLEHGATLERLRDAMAVPSLNPEEDTIPVDEPDTDVHPLIEFQ